MNVRDAKGLQIASLETPTDLGSNSLHDICGALNVLLTDVFAPYVKTKNFHWQLSGPYFHDYQLPVDEQAEQIFATSDAIAERVRKIGGAGQQTQESKQESEKKAPVPTMRHVSTKI